MDKGSYEGLTLKALKLMKITCAIGVGFLLAAFTAAGAALILYDKAAVGIAAISVGTALGIVIFALVPRLRFRRYKYLIAQDRIEIVKGIFFVKKTIVPIDRIHQIDVEKGPLDRAAGVAKVIVTTAGSAVAFRFLEPERAERLAAFLNDSVRERTKKTEASGDV